MPARRTARERVRAEITREITDIARGHLGAHGAAGLSLRAVAREMGMVSSAIYRYFPSRDELLTALIIDGYSALGAAVEAADRAHDRGDYAGRWLAGCRAARDWAVAHRHEYALIYGSPVPGYQAPADTVAPASRAVAVIGRLVSEAHTAGVLGPPVGPGPVPASLAEDAKRLGEAVMPAVPPDVALAALAAWASLFGVISFELFGQFTNVITDTGGYFDHAARSLGALVGLPVQARGGPGGTWPPGPPDIVPRWLARGRRPPVHGRAQRLRADPVRVPLGHLEQGLDERVREQVRLQAQVEQALVHHVVVVLGQLDPRVVDVLDRHVLGARRLDRLGDLLDRHPLRDLVEHAELTAVGRVLARELDAAHGVPDVDHAAGLAARAVHGERVPDDRLDDEAVQHRAEHRVVVEPGRQPLVPGRLRGLLAVDDALVEVGGAQVPDPAGELDVVDVVNLGH